MGMDPFRYVDMNEPELACDPSVMWNTMAHPPSPPQSKLGQVPVARGMAESTYWLQPSYESNMPKLGVPRTNLTYHRSVSAPPAGICGTMSVEPPSSLPIRSNPRPILGPLHSTDHQHGAGISFRSRTSSGSSWESSLESSSSPSFPSSSTSEFGSSGKSPDKFCNKPNGMQGNFCVFCKKNGETPVVYLAHELHKFNEIGQRIVLCPVLRKLVCHVCGQSGDNAHTISHCPKAKTSSVALMLKSTPRKCNGILRRHRSSYH